MKQWIVDCDLIFPHSLPLWIISNSRTSWILLLRKWAIIKHVAKHIFLHVIGLVSTLHHHRYLLQWGGRGYRGVHLILKSVTLLNIKLDDTEWVGFVPKINWVCVGVGHGWNHLIMRFKSIIWWWDGVYVF